MNVALQAPVLVSRTATLGQSDVGSPFTISGSGPGVVAPREAEPSHAIRPTSGPVLANLMRPPSRVMVWLPESLPKVPSPHGVPNPLRPGPRRARRGDPQVERPGPGGVACPLDRRDDRARARPRARDGWAPRGRRHPGLRRAQGPRPGGRPRAAPLR